MDRAWTGVFFLWPAAATQNAQAATFTPDVHRAGAGGPRREASQIHRKGWRTSRSKVLDNAIIGYIMLNEIACIRTGASPPWIQEPPLCTASPISSEPAPMMQIGQICAVLRLGQESGTSSSACENSACDHDGNPMPVPVCAGCAQRSGRSVTSSRRGLVVPAC
jgi:hypothetical protein